MMSRHYFLRGRRRSAQSTVELVAGIMAVIPIFLFLIDLGVMMLSSATNDSLCKQAARAAGNQATAGAANTAAGAVIDKLLGTGRTASSGIFRQIETMDDGTPPANPNAQNCVYGGASHPNNVVVTTRLSICLPVPFPFVNTLPQFSTRANVPIVAQLAQ